MRLLQFLKFGGGVWVVGFFVGVQYEGEAAVGGFYVGGCAGCGEAEDGVVVLDGTLASGVHCCGLVGMIFI